MSLQEVLVSRPSLADLTPILLRTEPEHDTPRPGEVWVRCKLCPNIIVEHESFTARCSTRARMYCLALFDDAGGDDGAVDVCGQCLAEVVLWCLDYRPDLLRAS